MTAFHSMMLLSVGAPLTPAGGSSCNLVGLKEWSGGGGVVSVNRGLLLLDKPTHTKLLLVPSLL